jgi:tetratricopeptide (TPR) repeat protein
MKKTLFILLLLGKLCPIFSQNIIEDATALMKAGRLGEAEDLVNRYLLEDPLNIDAIMMKGNVVLNKYLYEAELQGSLLRNFYEDVYDSGTLEKGERPVVVPDSVAAGVERFWTAALKLEPTREDIQLGLCQLYALSLQRQKLLPQLAAAKQHAKNDTDLPIQLANYARYLGDRGDFEGMMMAYRQIHQLYPTQSGLLSDMAGEYFFNGKLDSARHYLRLSLKDEKADQAVLGNAFYLGSLLGDYELALAAIQRLPGPSHLLYEGLAKFKEGEKKWKKPLEKLLESNPDSTEAAFARVLLADSFQVDLDNYLALNALQPGDAFKLLVHEKFRETGDFLPYFNAAETLCFNKCHARADEAFRLLERQTNLQLEAPDWDNINFYHAWSLHELKRYDEALPYFEKLLESEDFYKRSAACWFIGKRHFDLGNKPKAREYFSMVAGDAAASKFATMCWEYMGLE